MSVQPVSAPTDDIALAEKRVLVVDDNRAAAQTLAWALELLGFAVETCADGARALDLAASFKPEIVLLDIGMPGMNGYEVCRRLRQDPAFRSTVIIAQTGWSQPEFIRRSAEAGFDHHMVKPIDIGRLREIMTRLVADKRNPT